MYPWQMLQAFSPSESFNASGVSGQIEYNANDWLGLVADFGGYAVTRQGFATTHQISYVFGPRINLRWGKLTPFAQVLLGGVWEEDGITFGSVTAFGMTTGGALISTCPGISQFVLFKPSTSLRNSPTATTTGKIIVGLAPGSYSASAGNSLHAVYERLYRQDGRRLDVKSGYRTSPAPGLHFADYQH